MLFCIEKKKSKPMCHRLRCNTGPIAFFFTCTNLQNLMNFNKSIPKKKNVSKSLTDQILSLILDFKCRLSTRPIKILGFNYNFSTHPIKMLGFKLRTFWTEPILLFCKIKCVQHVYMISSVSCVSDLAVALRNNCCFIKAAQALYNISWC